VLRCRIGFHGRACTSFPNCPSFATHCHLRNVTTAPPPSPPPHLCRRPPSNAHTFKFKPPVFLPLSTKCFCLSNRTGPLLQASRMEPRMPGSRPFRVSAHLPPPFPFAACPTRRILNKHPFPYHTEPTTRRMTAQSITPKLTTEPVPVLLLPPTKCNRPTKTARARARTPDQRHPRRTQRPRRSTGDRFR
jgi:hypothetical protein